MQQGGQCAPKKADLIQTAVDKWPVLLVQAKSALLRHKVIVITLVVEKINNTLTYLYNI